MTARGMFAALALAGASALAGEPARLPASFLAGTIPGTLRYQVVIEGASGADISGQLGNLTNLEVLAGPVLSQQVTWRGAEATGVTVLTWVLRAHRLGPIAVGPTVVRIGDRSAVTNEVQGSAFAGGRVPAAGIQPEMSVDVSSPRLMVGEPLVVRFSVEALGAADAEGWEVQASFPESWSQRLPMAEVPTSLTGPGGFPRIPLGGWLVIPVQPGLLEIPPATARAVLAPGASEAAVLPVRTATSRPLAVDVAPLPPPPAPFFGAVGELAFSRRVLGDHLHVGDIATLELDVSGVGNLPLLDPPPLQLPDGVRAFPAEESHEWRPSRGGLVGWRRWRTPLEVSRVGTLELPAVRVCAFRPGTGYVTQTLPPLDLAVGAQARGAQAAPRSPDTTAARSAGPIVLPVAAGFVAGALLVGALAAWRVRRRIALPRPASGEPSAELRALQLAVERWAHARFAVPVADGTARLTSAGCPAAQAEEAVALVLACERLRFAPSLADPAEALANLRARVTRLVAASPAPADTLGA